jgi:hypothetical protein
VLCVVRGTAVFVLAVDPFRRADHPDGGKISVRAVARAEFPICRLKFFPRDQRTEGRTPQFIVFSPFTMVILIVFLNQRL